MLYIKQNNNPVFGVCSLSSTPQPSPSFNLHYTPVMILSLSKRIAASVPTTLLGMVCGTRVVRCLRMWVVKLTMHERKHYSDYKHHDYS